MSDTSSGAAPTAPVTIIPLTEGFPSSALPTVFADGIANVAPANGVIRFYLYRSDPDQVGGPAYKNQAIAQVVMPVSGFLQAAAFFEKSVDFFVSQGTIAHDAVIFARKSEGL